MDYQTRQRQSLIAFLKKNADAQMTVEAIAAGIGEKEPISVSAVYRNLNKLVSEGSVERFASGAGRGFLYQYLGGSGCLGHIHMKCGGCGHIFHMDDGAVKRIVDLAKETDQFEIDKKKTILFGRCKACLEK